MVTFIVHMRFDPKDHQEIREILAKLATASRQEPGCTAYIPHFVDGDPSNVLIYEQYTDESATEFHRTTPHFKRFAIAGLYQRMLDRQIENLSAVI